MPKSFGNEIEHATQTGFQSACSEYAEQTLSLDQVFDTIGPGKVRLIAPYDIPLFKIQKGDYLHIDRGAPIKNGMLVLVSVDDETGIFKKHSKGLSPHRLTQEQIENATCFAITGLSRNMIVGE